MKEYLGIKTVKAKPMTLGVYYDYRGWTIPPDENPDTQGFLVEHIDGSVSWRAKKLFTEAYTELGTNQLIETVIGMKSGDYKERFKAEYTQLKIRCLSTIMEIAKLKNNELPFKPKCSLELLEKQLDAMNKYLGTLEERAFIEEIELY